MMAAQFSYVLQSTDFLAFQVALLVGDDARLNLLALCRALAIEARNQGMSWY